MSKHKMSKKYQDFEIKTIKSQAHQLGLGQEHILGKDKLLYRAIKVNLTYDNSYNEAGFWGCEN